MTHAEIARQINHLTTGLVDYPGVVNLEVDQWDVTRAADLAVLVADVAAGAAGLENQGTPEGAGFGFVEEAAAAVQDAWWGDEPHDETAQAWAHKNDDPAGRSNAQAALILLQLASALLALEEDRPSGVVQQDEPDERTTALVRKAKSAVGNLRVACSVAVEATRDGWCSAPALVRRLWEETTTTRNAARDLSEVWPRNSTSGLVHRASSHAAVVAGALDAGNLDVAQTYLRDVQTCADLAAEDATNTLVD